MFGIPGNINHVFRFINDVVLLGAICGSAISMDLLAQSMDPYSAQKSMDCADICGSLRVVACAVRGKYSPARQRYYRTRVCCAISVVIFLDSLHYMFGQLFPTYPVRSGSA